MTFRQRLNHLQILVVALGVLAVHQSASAAVDFNRDIAPIFVKRCLECHNARQQVGGLSLATAAAFKKGGDSGVVFNSKQPAQSLLLKRLHAGEMPPLRKGESQKLPADELKVVEQWVASGSPWPPQRVLDLYEATNDVRGGRDWWSFQPVVKPKLPVLKNGRRIQNAIDAFVFKKLEDKQLQAASQASKAVLIRRLYFDLVGLPPTFEQIQTFVNDKDPRAFEKIVDRLLASPAFGERWGRYWLDLVRFAETCGYERDQEKPGIWMYRDWVVQALNNDMPYNEFIVHQLAGDEIAQPTKASVSATGFLMAGTWNDEPNDINEYQYERLEDMIHVTSSAFLGLTVKCARCHNHKFDPIPQTDYYRFANAFWSGPIRRGGKTLGASTKEELGFDVFGWTDLGSQPQPLRLLKNGDPKKPLEVIAPGHLTLVPKLVTPIEPAQEGSKTTTLRLQLAQWIADPKNPLTPRVIVNRVWQHHFGRGLVHSPNNFGFRGALPTHPKLLEWLAADLLQGNWKLKRIHKQIVMSAAWQQSSVHPQQAAYGEVDSENHFLWRTNRRRLDAEALRDAMLCTSGQIDLRVGGPSFRPTVSAEALEGLSRKQSAWNASPVEEQRRRSLYMYSKRGLLPPLMTTFDFSDTTLPCGQRDVTIVPTQALALLNNHFPHQRSSALMKRIDRHKKRAAVAQLDVTQLDVAQQVKLAWRYCMLRDPNAHELQASIAHVKSQAKYFADGITGETKPGNKAASPTAEPIDVPVAKGLVLSLRADHGVEQDKSGHVVKWSNRAGLNHVATQTVATHRPLLTKGSTFAQPSIYFGGKNQFLNIAGELLKQPQCTLIAVANDAGKLAQHREILSNWNRQRNVTTSLFLGVTGPGKVRFSDNYSSTETVASKNKPFALFAVNDLNGTRIIQNNRVIAERTSPLSDRKFGTPWVIGQQGNINGEFWNGHIAEILVYDRGLTESEQRSTWDYLRRRYGLKGLAAVSPSTTPEEKALASLCHVLMNSNEFIFVD